MARSRLMRIASAAKLPVCGYHSRFAGETRRLPYEAGIKIRARRFINLRCSVHPDRFADKQRGQIGA